MHDTRYRTCLIYFSEASPPISVSGTMRTVFPAPEDVVGYFLASAFAPAILPPPRSAA